MCGVEAEIVVLPGIFDNYNREEAGKRLSFESNPRSEFLPLLTYTVFEKALEANATSIALDVSHGMNFVPTLALRAAEEAAAALAAAKIEPVKLKVYQSDPYPPGFQKLERSKEDVCKPSQDSVEPPSLRYNLILEKTFEPWDLTRYTSYEGGQVLKVLTDQKGCNLSDVQNLLKEWALPLLGAFRLGALPQLALLAKAAPLRGFRKAVESAIECWKRKRIVQKGNTLRVVSGTRFASGFWALIHARAVLEGTRKLISARGSAPPEEATLTPPLEKTTVTLEELKSLKKLLEGSKVVKMLVNREISKLEDQKGQWSSKYRSEGGDNGTFKRDFIAHAGFHIDVLEVRLVGKELEIRMKSDQWKRVKEVLCKVTQEGAV